MKLREGSLTALMTMLVAVTGGVAESQPKEAELLDSRYRRDFITCDNQLLNGEMFLQVKISKEKYYIDFK